MLPIYRDVLLCNRQEEEDAEQDGNSEDEVEEEEEFYGGRTIWETEETLSPLSYATSAATKVMKMQEKQSPCRQVLRTT